MLTKDDAVRMLTKDDAELAYSWLFTQYISALHRICNIKNSDPTIDILGDESPAHTEIYTAKRCIFLMKLLRTEFGITMYTADESEYLQTQNETVWNRIFSLDLSDQLSNLRIR